MNKAYGRGILGAFTLSFVILMAGIAAQQNGIDPSGVYLLTLLPAGCGVYLVAKGTKSLGSFGIK